MIPAGKAFWAIYANQYNLEKYIIKQHDLYEDCWRVLELILYIRDSSCKNASWRGFISH